MARGLTCGVRGCREHAAAGEPSTPLPSLPGLRDARLLGRGGFGTVLAGVREGSGERVAVKVARADVPDARAQLEREGAALRAVGGAAT